MKILVPTDFSKASANALRHACGIADKANGKVTVLYVRPVHSRHDTIMINIDEEVNRNSADDLNRFMERMASEYGIGSRISSAIISGVPREEICKYAALENFDLIVVGTEVKSAFQKILLGTTSVYVIDHASSPVMIVPESFDTVRFRQGTFNTDLQNLVREFEIFYKLASKFVEEVDVLHISDRDSKEVLEEFEKEIQAVTGNKEYGKVQFIARRNNSVSDGIAAYVQSERTDFIVLLLRKRSFIEKMLSQSITKQLTDKILIPILVFAKPEKSV